MFRRSAVHYGKTPEPETPYQRAAQVWDDRIGSARVQARNWRLMAFACLGLVVGLSAALVWQATRGTIVPWVVEVDKLGQAASVGPATEGFLPSDPQIAYQLSRFIEQVRGIATDPIIVRQNWLRAYDMTTRRGALVLSDHARDNDPFSRVGKEQVSVEVNSVIRASPSSFRIAWTERTYRDGSLTDTARWSAILTVAVQQPSDPERLQANPLGIYVDAINWSKELGS